MMMAGFNIERTIGAAFTVKDQDLDDLLRRARSGLNRELQYERRPQAAAGVIRSPLGDLFVAVTKRGVAMIHYLAGPDDLASTTERLRARIDLAVDRRTVEDIAKEVRGYVAGNAAALRREIDLSLAQSPFQQKVLGKLQEVPRGALISYQALSAAAGAPRGARAVGNAMHNNPVPIYVPCHRVIASGGGLGGYGGGVQRKLQLLRAEGFDLSDGAKKIPESSVWGHKGTKIYCRAGCRSAARADPSRILFFSDGAGARRCGLRPCKICRPE
jgi:methylated-DNA-[protein]-cysteine S-methyltransferase